MVSTDLLVFLYNTRKQLVAENVMKLLIIFLKTLYFRGKLFHPPASEASKEVSNSTEEKIHNLSICLSVCLLQTLTPIISQLAD